MSLGTVLQKWRRAPKSPGWRWFSGPLCLCLGLSLWFSGAAAGQPFTRGEGRIREIPQVESRYDSSIRAYEEGYKAYRLGHFPEAEKFLKEALALEPNLIKAHYWLGKLFREMGMLKESVFHEEEVLRLKKLISERRLALSTQNNEYPALAQIEITREREKKALDSYERGKKFLAEGQWDGAVAEFKNAVALYPGNEEYLVMLSRILWDRRDLQGSARFYAELLNRFPSKRDWALEALDRVIESGNTAAAGAFLRRLMGLFPGDADFSKRLSALETQDRDLVTFMGKIVRRDRSQVVLDFGFDKGLKLADEFALGLRAFIPGDAVLRPDTGNEIGRTPDRLCGNLLVTKVFANSCWALVQQEFGPGVKAGDLVEIKSPGK